MYDDSYLRAVDGWMLWSISRAAAAKPFDNTGFEATGEGREAGDGISRAQYEWSRKTRKTILLRKECMADGSASSA
jgi:hypothetical protein